MKQYLIEIEHLLREKNVVTYEGLSSEVLMNGPASEKDIVDIEHALRKKIPDDYLTFLKNYNGGILFKFEDLGGFRFFSTQEIVKGNVFQKKQFGDDWDDDILLFGQGLGDDEYVGFRCHSDRYEILDCVMDMMPDE